MCGKLCIQVCTHVGFIPGCPSRLSLTKALPSLKTHWCVLQSSFSREEFHSESPWGTILSRICLGFPTGLFGFCTAYLCLFLTGRHFQVPPLSLVEGECGGGQVRWSHVHRAPSLPPETYLQFALSSCLFPLGSYGVSGKGFLGSSCVKFHLQSSSAFCGRSGHIFSALRFTFAFNMV